MNTLQQHCYSNSEHKTWTHATKPVDKFAQILWRGRVTVHQITKKNNCKTLHFNDNSKLIVLYYFRTTSFYILDVP